MLADMDEAVCRETKRRAEKKGGFAATARENVRNGDVLETSLARGPRRWRPAI